MHLRLPCQIHFQVAAVKGVAVDLAGEGLQIAVDLREQLGGFIEHLGDACADAGFFFQDEIHHGGGGGKFGQAKLDAARKEQLVVIRAHLVCPCLDAGALARQCSARCLGFRPCGCHRLFAGWALVLRRLSRWAWLRRRWQGG